MAFVKLDCGMLDSTIWFDRDAREVFITALLMAVPHEITEETKQISVGSLKETGYTVPAGWYGFVAAAGPGIVHRAKVDETAGMAALERLCSPEESSRTPDFEGRRMIRVDGGYLILNYDRYRRKDHTAAERAQRYRDSHKSSSRVTLRESRVTSRSVTHADAEADAKYRTPVVPLEGDKPAEQKTKDPLMQRAEKLFNRRPETTWDRSEMKAWNGARPAVAATSAADWQLLERWFALPQDKTKSRKGLAALLNNWNTEISRAQIYERDHPKNQYDWTDDPPAAARA